MPKFHTLTVVEIRRETPACVSIAFDVPEALREEYRFTQGQFLTLKTTLDGEEVRRSYSICSSPLEQGLRVAVKKIPEGRFSSFANETLKAGDQLEVMTPMGNFNTALDPANRKHYVAFAAGSGITPILSILKTTLSLESHSTFTLFFGNRTVDSIIFREELEGLKNLYLGRLSIFHILSGEDQGSELLSGRIDGKKCETIFTRLLDPEDVDEVFLCGPESMIHSVSEYLQHRGIDRRQIHAELFTTGLSPEHRRHAPWKAEKPAFQAQVTVRLDGNTFRFSMDSTQETILNAALRAGADLPFACKGGVCCTCRARISEGKVTMEVNYALEPEEVAAGYALTCQSHPLTESVFVDFDA